jgi:hypothetical protein
VRVDVECHPLIRFGAGTAEGYPYRFEVPLLTPLGDRPVLDGLGAEAVRCVAVRCGMPG